MSTGIVSVLYPAIRTTTTTNLYKTWVLPGNIGQTNNNCGDFMRFIACPEHFDDTYRPIKISCKRPGCPVCYESWAARAAHRASERLAGVESAYNEVNMTLGSIRHIVFSPPQEHAKMLMASAEGYRKLKAELRDIMKQAGLKGGSPIFHSHRTKTMQIAPHFHVNGWGYLEKSDVLQKRTGWVYKNLGTRDSLYETIKYELTHCGIFVDPDEFDPHKFDALTYFGCASYNKVAIKTETVTKDPVLCPICDREMHIYLEEDGLDQGVYHEKIIHRKYHLRIMAKPPPTLEKW